MPVMPEKGENIAKGYPTREGQRTLEVIGLPDFIYKPFESIRKIWKELTTFPAGKRKSGDPEPVPGRKMKLSYSREGMDDCRGMEGTMDMFYRYMSGEFGVPVKEVSYDIMADVIRNTGGEVLPGRYVSGVYLPGGKGLALVSKTDDNGIPMSKKKKAAAAFHECMHHLENVYRLENRGEFGTQTMAIETARKRGFGSVADQLQKDLEDDPVYYAKYYAKIAA